MMKKFIVLLGMLLSITTSVWAEYFMVDNLKYTIFDGHTYHVTAIYGRAFDEDTINSVTIPASITRIIPYAFNGYGLRRIVVDEDNPVYDSRNDCNAVITTQGDTLIAGCATTTIPSDVKVIGREVYMEDRYWCDSTNVFCTSWGYKYDFIFTFIEAEYSVTGCKLRKN